jgi:hypothetical protein
VSTTKNHFDPGINCVYIISTNLKDCRRTMLLQSIIILRLLIATVIAASVVSFSPFARSVARHLRTASLFIKDGKQVDEMISAFSYGGRPTEEKLEEYKLQYARSIDKSNEFWEEQARKHLAWFSFPLETFSGSFLEGDVSWFSGGKLNACFNCIDRHLPKRADQTAIIWEADEPSDSRDITYRYYLRMHVIKYFQGFTRR